MNYELWIRNYELRIMNYELWITNYDLRITSHELLIIISQRFIHVDITNYEFHAHFKALIDLSKKKHNRNIRHSHIRDTCHTRHIRHTRHHSRSVYIFFALIRLTRLFAARLWVMYRRLNVIWCWAMTRSRSTSVIEFAFTIASREKEKMRIMNEDRILCDSKKRKKKRIRRRCRRLMIKNTNDSNFESLFRFRASSTFATTTAYLINFEKHENELFTNHCEDCISSFLSYNDIRCNCF